MKLVISNNGFGKGTLPRTLIAHSSICIIAQIIDSWKFFLTIATELIV